MNINFYLPDINLVVPLIVPFKMAIAVLIGLVVGRERKKHQKPGGARTFAIVCLGACLTSILSLELVELYNFDFTRLMSYAIASIGFIGSGVIMKNHDKVEGLTTASTLWIMIPIGFFVGLGYYSMGILSSIFVYAILEGKKPKRRKKNVEN